LARGSLGTAISSGSKHWAHGAEGLERGDVLRLRALRTLRDVEGNRLVLFERTETVRVDRGVVDEDVRAATFLGDEAKALFGVEPLHGSGSHKPSLGPKGCPAPEPASVKTVLHNCILLKTTRARGHMLRRLCTARETKLQLAASLARGQPKAIEGKITSLGRLKVSRWD